MAPTSRPDGQLNLNLSSMSPITDPSSATSSKSLFTTTKPVPSVLPSNINARVGAGSPLNDQTSRLFPKRTRELQSQSGLSPNIWGPPTSGTSTPLFEIPESPSQDGFPDLIPLTENGINSPARRGRAGTLPSRISPVGTINGVSILQGASKTSRPTPSTSPFRPGSTSAAESAFYGSSSNTNTAALLSRFRAGSLPQRSGLLNPGSSFGASPFASGWSTRSRAATLTSVNSLDDASSPQQSNFPRDGLIDPEVRTLDYLGLAETSQPTKYGLSQQVDNETSAQNQPFDVLANLNLRNSGRFRSFSVNTQPKYNSDGQDGSTAGFGNTTNSSLSPSVAAALEAEYEAVQEKVRLHNQAVQAFAVNATAARPRASTAGLVETPQRTSLRGYVEDSSLDTLGTQIEDRNVNGILDTNFADSFQNLNIEENNRNLYDGYEDAETQMSRSLWIGSIPNSTTMSSLDAIFNHYGPIESTRVLTHKNCGFVNFENVENAVRARQLLNGKEIFPGAGPVRIGFAKVPTSTSATPVPNGFPPSPTDDLKANQPVGSQHNLNGESSYPSQPINREIATTPGRLTEQRPELLQIVQELGAQHSDIASISSTIDSAIAFQQLEMEVPPMSDPSPARVYDAPRLRDVRKRIDNGACDIQEIEQTALDMLPEIAELSSDYLGNTVVQKLFEYCSEQTKEQMLVYIAPHLAEIGIHKNGTWAAQKIIEVCKTDSQTRMIIDGLRPYTVPLFLDQYGNYVVQCCLRFGPPYNDFIFETMLSKMWEIAQGRFGARAMRACLEAHHATKHQQRLLAAAVVLHSVQLATNANGALLLTWLLDTCTFQKRRTVLAPRLVPHLVQLCTHKVAYLTVLKVINQRNEPEARDMILQALFFSPNDTILEQILREQTSGVTLIFKILTTPFLDDQTRPDIVRNISKVLTKIKAQPNQGYKRLMDEVGLSSRPPQPAPQHFQNHTIPTTNEQGRQISQAGLPMPPHLSTQQRQYNGNYVSNINPTPFETGLSPNRTGSADSFGFSPYAMNGYQNQQPYSQVQYQQMPSQPQYPNYPGAGQRSTSSYYSNGYNNYPRTSSSVDPFRSIQNQSSSPLPFTAQMSPILNSGGYNTQSYPSNIPNNMYTYPQQQYFFSPPMQPVHTVGRGRRR